MTDENNQEAPNAFEARHAAIIARTLRWADHAAARHDYGEALRWVETVRRFGNSLPDDYETKRRRWLLALDPRSSCASSDQQVARRADLGDVSAVADEAASAAGCRGPRPEA